MAAPPMRKRVFGISMLLSLPLYLQMYPMAIISIACIMHTPVLHQTPVHEELGMLLSVLLRKEA